MKLVTVQFPDSTDLSSIPKGSAVSIGSVSGGTVLAITEMYEPPAAPAQLVPHTHEVAGTAMLSGPVNGNTGPAVP
jgi:hypothetical protein